MEKNYMICALRAAVEAGHRIMEVYNDAPGNMQVELKADQSPLTRADREAHDIISQRLSARTPYPILSEEGAHQPFAERKEWPVLWVVDPLDGTKEFIGRNGQFTVNIALVEKGAPVAGVIYVPVSGTLYFAFRGEGAYRLALAEDEWPGEDWEELKSHAQRLPLPGGHEGFVVVASRSHLSPETADYIDQVRSRHADVRTLSAGSSLKLCLVAEGAADVYPRLAPTMEWDTAAGDAIAREAGCVVVDARTDSPLTYNKEDLHNPWFVVRREEDEV